MSAEKFRKHLARCAYIIALAVSAFVWIKSRNDWSIARDTSRIAVAAESINMAKQVWPPLSAR